MKLEPKTPEITTNDEVKQEVQKTLEQLKNRKAAGKDGIANELLKYCRAALTERLTTLINKIYKTTEFRKNGRQAN